MSNVKISKYTNIERQKCRKTKMSKYKNVERQKCGKNKNIERRKCRRKVFSLKPGKLKLDTLLSRAFEGR
jgi:hypothetical protein